MKKLKTKKVVVILSAVLLLLAAYLLYSRPMTIRQRYPMLNPDQCMQLSGYYEIDGQAAFTEFTIDRNSEAFETLCSLLYEQTYCRSLRDLLPRGTRIHAANPGDFEWEVFFHFENVAFPDGSIGSGKILRIQCWYGELDIYFDDQQLSCHTAQQETWVGNVLGVIQSSAAN